MAQGDNPEIERKMLAGCVGYVLLSLGGFCLGAWPFFLWTRHWLISELALCFAAGLLPSLALGVWGTRQFGIPGASGFFASALATAIFLYLRLWQMFMGWDAKRSPEPEYPRAFLWLAPCAWIFLVAFVAVAFLRQTNDDPD